MILAIDGGLAKLGWALLEPEPLRLVRCGVITTRKAKGREAAWAETPRRARELWDGLDSLTWGSMDVVCSESLSFPRNASTAGKLGAAFGVVCSISRSYGLALVVVGPQEVKERLTGRRNASDELLNEAIMKMLQAHDFEIEGIGKRASDRQHAMDAIAVGLACLKNDVVVAATRRR